MAAEGALVDDDHAGAGGDIVVGVDGSEESFQALRWALREGALHDRRVNAVFGWTKSWDMGPQPDDDETWERMRHRIVDRLRAWVDTACEGVDFDSERLTLTSVHATGTSALLRIGEHAQQIVVGRRAMAPVLRWLLGSASASLAQSAQAPVTIVRSVDDHRRVEDEIASALLPDRLRPRPGDADDRPVAVGVDGSDTSVDAVRFAADVARTYRVPLHVLCCWRMQDYASTSAVATVDEGQRRAEATAAAVVERAGLADDLDVRAHAFHIAPVKGLIAASRHARRLVIGSRGLNGTDAHVLGSVSRQVVDLAECTLTVVH